MHDLAPYAVPVQGTLGREHPDTTDNTRNPFQRDRDRIVGSNAFKRLKGKTQVFVEVEGDHYRTRLPHTLEVMLVSRDIARHLKLNEDLAECIALAHDLGHPPYGHAGEEALNAWMQQKGSHFEHNEQSHRLVTILEEHSNKYPGLNLNMEITEGLLKHTTPFDNPDSASIGRSPTLEAQVANLADEIAYNAHDPEDGLRAELFTLDEILEVPLIKQAHDTRLERGTALRGAIIGLTVQDLYKETTKNLVQMPSRGVSTLDDIYSAKAPIVTFSDAMRKGIDELRSFLFERMYSHPDVRKRNEEGQQILVELCNTYYANPNEKILALEKRTGSSRLEAVKDYVSGMTDRFARNQ